MSERQIRIKNFLAYLKGLQHDNLLDGIKETEFNDELTKIFGKNKSHDKKETIKEIRRLLIEKEYIFNGIKYLKLVPFNTINAKHIMDRLLTNYTEQNFYDFAEPIPDNYFSNKKLAAITLATLLIYLNMYRQGGKKQKRRRTNKNAIVKNKQKRRRNKSQKKRLSRKKR